MTRIAGVRMLVVTLAAAGCGVGGGDSGPMGPMGTPVPPIDEGEVCTGTFQLSGTFTLGTPRPTDPDTGAPQTGCWPVGTWTFSATVGSSECNPAPTVLGSYSFKVGLTPVDPADPNSEMMQTLTDQTGATGMRTHLKMVANGQGCEGLFELGSADGKQYWAMQPTLSKDPAATMIAGSGDYTLYKVDGWPWK